MLAKVEYQQGHVEEALRVLDGINTAELIPMVKMSISRLARADPHSSYPPMPLHTVNLVMETIYLKTAALRDLGKFKGTTPTSCFCMDAHHFIFSSFLSYYFKHYFNSISFCRSCTGVQYDIGRYRIGTA